MSTKCSIWYDDESNTHLYYDVMDNRVHLTSDGPPMTYDIVLPEELGALIQCADKDGYFGSKASKLSLLEQGQLSAFVSMHIAMIEGSKEAYDRIGKEIIRLNKLERGEISR